jgi:dephospho-CoA kinase
MASRYRQHTGTGLLPAGHTEQGSVLLSSAMPAIGITGGISTGKTTFVNCLRRLFPEAMFFDADIMARELTHHDQAILAKIREKFGNDVFDASRGLNRDALRGIVFAASEKRRQLEQILHPPIRRHWSREAEKHRPSNQYFFADIPLLYETGGEKLCDRVVVVACSEEIQMRRLMQRTGLDRNAAEGIISAQMPLSEKVKLADHVIWNNGPEGLLEEQARFLTDIWIGNL